SSPASHFNGLVTLRLHQISALFSYTTLFRSRWFITRLSVTLSSAEVASSSMSSAGPGNTARAMAMRCRWPPDSDAPPSATTVSRSEEHTSELQSRENLVCRLLLEKKKKYTRT